MQPAQDFANRLPVKAIQEVIEQNRSALRLPGVIAVRPGYQFTNGWITKKPAIIAFVRNKGSVAPESVLPRFVGEYAVDVRQAPPHLQVEYDQAKDASRFPLLLAPFATEPEAPELEEDAAAHIPYRPPHGVALARVQEQMNIRCSAGPDAGFPELKGFLESTGHRLTVGMYEFSVKHILNALMTGLGTTKSLKLVLDSKEDPGGDITEVELFDKLSADLGPRLSFVWAPVRGRKTVTKWAFPSAYHIKVAVRDGKSFWLSSGNWTRASQPDNPTSNWPKALNNSNREWHVIVDHEGLSKTFESFLENDLREASAVQSGILESDTVIESDMPVVVLAPAPHDEHDALPPLPPVPAKEFAGVIDVMPLLTPDNFTAAILELLDSAQESIFMQTQYFTVTNQTTTLKKLVALFKRKQEAGLDIRLIFRGDGNGAQEQLEALTAFGIEPERIKFQRRVHNKGIVVDGKIVVVGSQNWSEPGVTVNRDASLILRNLDIAKYFNSIFVHDWTRLAKHFVQNEQDRPLIADATADVPAGARIVSWAEHYANVVD